MGIIVFLSGIKQGLSMPALFSCFPLNSTNQRFRVGVKRDRIPWPTSQCWWPQEMAALYNYHSRCALSSKQLADSMDNHRQQCFLRNVSRRSLVLNDRTHFWVYYKVGKDTGGDSYARKWSRHAGSELPLP